MKRLLLSTLLISVSTVLAQNPDTAKYAPLPIMLVDSTPGTEGIMPMVVSENGSTHVEFVPVSKIKEAMDRGATLIFMGDLLTVLNESKDKIARLQAENDKLWQVAMKSTEVTVQQSGPSPEQIAASKRAEDNARRQNALMLYMMMQGNRPQPYVLPQPTNPNANRVQTTCTTYRMGDMTHTNCN